MSTLAVILILISAITHAAWNFFGKRERPTAALFLVATLLGGILLLPPLFYYHDRLAAIPTGVWWMLALTGLFQGSYFGMLAAAYRNGDMSLAYPLARSIPTLLVIALAFLMGSGKEISGLCLSGMVLVIIGCSVLPMARFEDLRVANYANSCCCFALLAAVGTAGYSVIDSKALHDMCDNSFTKLEAALIYAPLEAFASSFWLGLYVLFYKPERLALRDCVRNSKRRATVMAIGIYGAYTLVLLAMTYARHVSYVLAFRQLSIPLGAMLGIVILNEPRHTPKAIGVAAVFAGVVLVGLG